MPSLVTTDWLADHLSEPSLRVIEVDWDGLDSYRDGHIPGAVGWNWKDALWDPFEREFPSDEIFSERLGAAGVTRDTTVVLYGSPVQFGTYAWWVFTMMGHPDVRLLDGGQTKWEREGRPIDRDEPQPGPSVYAPAPRDERTRAGRDAVLKAIGNPDCVILDHRSYEEYSGQRVGVPGKPNVGAERAGRIPGARHLPFEELLNEDTTFKSAEELRKIFGAHVPDPGTPVISYCRLSHRATLARFAMTEILGYRDVRVYDGSWTEWGSMVGMPIER
jgi:thiosulfate/3-mercaptopyruvate sulfurtransferase